MSYGTPFRPHDSFQGKGFTPLKINMEPQNEGLEDVFPFQMGDFPGSMLVFWGVSSSKRNPHLLKMVVDFQAYLTPIAIGYKTIEIGVHVSY